MLPCDWLIFTQPQRGCQYLNMMTHPFGKSQAMKVPRTCIGLTPEGCWSLAGRTCLCSRQGTVETKGPRTSSGTGHWVLLGEKASVGGLTYCTEITENAPKPLPKLNVPWPFQILSQHFHSDSHTQTHSAFPHFAAIALRPWQGVRPIHGNRALHASH